MHYFGAAFLLWECSTPFGESLLLSVLRCILCGLQRDIRQYIVLTARLHSASILAMVPVEDRQGAHALVPHQWPDHDSGVLPVPERLRARCAPAAPCSVPVLHT